MLSLDSHVACFKHPVSGVQILTCTFLSFPFQTGPRLPLPATNQ